MKKTVTANIGGLVFHIEEDAYDILRSYLESIRAYFSRHADGHEIMSDIEARIAELLSGMLGSGRQAVQEQDVKSVMQQVGSLEAIREAEDGENAGGTAEDDPRSPADENHTGEKRLFRDPDHAIAGGVCSGIAAYFGVNPLWVRLAFTGLAFGFIPLMPALSGPLVLAYLVLWAVMPARKGLVNPGKFKRFFRSGKDKVLAGVCGGISRYFNIDPALVRLGFFLAIFAGGSGLILYVLLWLITPEASSLSDEVRMEGQAITLNSLEEQIKKRVSPDEKGAESAVSKVLLFPFRLLSRLISGLSPLLVFLVDLVRIFWAVVLMLTGSILLFGIGVAALSLLGWISAETYHIQLGELPVDRIAGELSPYLVGFGALTFIIPAFAVLLLGLSLAVKKRVLGPGLGLGLFAAFLLSAMTAGFLLIPKLNEFRREGQVVKTSEFAMPYQSISLLLNKEGEEKEESRYFPLGLKISSYEGKTVMLRQVFKAQGPNMDEARKNARFASLSVVQADSSLIFDRWLKLDDEAPFRAQRLEMELLLPEGFRFRMDRDLLNSMLENELPVSFDESGLESGLWVVKNGQLICLSSAGAEKPHAAEGDSLRQGEW